MNTILIIKCSKVSSLLSTVCRTLCSAWKTNFKNWRQHVCITCARQRLARNDIRPSTVISKSADRAEFEITILPELFDTTYKSNYHNKIRGWEVLNNLFLVKMLEIYSISFTKLNFHYKKIICVSVDLGMAKIKAGTSQKLSSYWANKCEERYAPNILKFQGTKLLMCTIFKPISVFKFILREQRKYLIIVNH